VGGMSEVGYVTTGEAPVTRSLAAVLRDSFSGTDDAVRLIVGTLQAVFPTDPNRSKYVTVTIAGNNIVVPYLGSSRLYAQPIGSAVYLLATRTSLLALGTIGAQS